MTDIEKMRAWLLTYEGMPQAEDFQIDYYSGDQSSASLTPNGLTEISRTEYVDGSWVATNQLHFSLEIVMSKFPDHGEVSAGNAEWLLALQRWVQRESVLRRAPTFGNVDQADEIIKAQNGAALESVDGDLFLYTITLSAQFKEEIKEDV